MSDKTPINLHNIASRGADIARAHGKLMDKRAADVDRSVFNYGRALGAPVSFEYVAFEKYYRGLSGVAMQFSAAQWRLEMALKAVRDACTEDEQAQAMTAAREAFHSVDRELERVECEPLKWFRYGRIGNVLKTFNPFAKA